MKKIFINNLVITILLLFSFCTSHKEIKYNYLINGKSENDAPYLGMQYEFSTLRKYYNDKLFKESQLFTGSESEYSYFKIANHCWYYEMDNQWNLFFDCLNKKGGKIRLVGSDYYKIDFVKEIFLRNKNLYRIHLNPINFMINHQPTYYFDQNEGIVIISTSSGHVLIRTDYIRVPLTENEIEELIND